MMNMEATTIDPAWGGRDVAAETRRLRRRRTRTWLAFGLVGMMMGAVWAVGIATSAVTLDIAGAEDPDQVFGTAPGTAGTSQYAGLVTEDTALEIKFKGTWGKIDADTPIFEVDLTAETGTFFLAIYLNNNPSGWAALQLEWLQMNSACASADFTSPDATSVMVIEDEDAWAVYEGLASGAGSTYCIGIADTGGKANDSAGTYIKRPSKSSSPTAPEFVGILNRSA